MTVIFGSFIFDLSPESTTLSHPTTCNARDMVAMFLNLFNFSCPLAPKVAQGQFLFDVVDALQSCTKLHDTRFMTLHL